MIADVQLPVAGGPQQGHTSCVWQRCRAVLAIPCWPFPAGQCTCCSAGPVCAHCNRTIYVQPLYQQLTGASIGAGTQQLKVDLHRPHVCMCCC